MPSPHPETITYEIDKWLQSKWQRDTRLYTLTLWQNIYGAPASRQAGGLSPGLGGVL